MKAPEKPPRSRTYGKAERVDGKQRAPSPPSRARPQRRDGAEHRADARRPAKGERKPHDIGARQRRRLAAALKPRLTREQRMRITPRKFSPMRMMMTPADLRQEIDVLAQHHADRRGPCPERDEDGGKPSVKAKAEKNTAPPRGAAAAPPPSALKSSMETPAM